jgi:hypothetical protein
MDPWLYLILLHYSYKIVETISNYHWNGIWDLSIA